MTINAVPDADGMIRADQLPADKVAWLHEQQRIDWTHVKLCRTIARGFTSGDPAEMANAYPDILASAAEAAADMELVGWAEDLARDGIAPAARPAIFDRQAA